MKFRISLLLILTSFAAYSQSESNPPKALFKVSPAHFAINTLKLGAEIFNKTQTKSIVFYGYGRLENSQDLSSYYDEQYNGLGCELQYRKYISPLKSYTTRRNRNYLQGIYAAGYLQGGSFVRKGDFVQYTYTGSYPPSSTTYYLHESAKNLGTGFIIGVQRTLWSVLFIDAYLGGGIQWSDVSKNIVTAPGTTIDYYNYNDITSPGYQGIMPKFGLQIGIAL
jgi:hypothetical protein